MTTHQSTADEVRALLAVRVWLPCFACGREIADEGHELDLAGELPLAICRACRVVFDAMCAVDTGPAAPRFTAVCAWAAAGLAP